MYINTIFLALDETPKTQGFISRSQACLMLNCNSRQRFIQMQARLAKRGQDLPLFKFISTKKDGRKIAIHREYFRLYDVEKLVTRFKEAEISVLDFINGKALRKARKPREEAPIAF